MDSCRKVMEDNLQFVLLIGRKAVYADFEKAIVFLTDGVGLFIPLQLPLQIFVQHRQVVYDVPEGVGIILA